jgi:hypothetical protein
MRASKRKLDVLVVLIGAAAIAGCGGGKEPDVDDAGAQKRGHGAVSLAVLSSPARYVSGGDARIGVRASPGLRDKLEVWINGVRSSAELVEVGDVL